MKLIDRRIFLTGGAASSTLCCGMPSYARSSRNQLRKIRGETPGCIFARIDAPKHSLNKDSERASIDFWTLRWSEIECAILPTSINRVVGWGDIFSRSNFRYFAEDTQTILDGLREYYGFAESARETQCEFHLEGVTEISSVIKNTLTPKQLRSTGLPRIAVIDIGSHDLVCNWANILPTLKANYDLLVGLLYFAEERPLETSALSEADRAFSEAVDEEFFGNDRVALECCDLSLLTSGTLLGARNLFDSDERHHLLKAFLEELIHSLSERTFICEKIITSGVSTFGISLLSPRDSKFESKLEANEYQRHSLLLGLPNINLRRPFIPFIEDENSSPIKNERFSLWPLRLRTDNEM